jgi:hypothetical protein
LTAAWPFTEGGGDKLRDIVGAGDGTINGSPAWHPSPAGRSMLFDKVDDYVSVPSSSANNFTKNWTISFWRRCNAFGGGSMINKVNPVGYSGSYQGANYKQYAIRGGDKIVLDYEYNGNNWDVRTSTLSFLRDDAWHLITVTMSPALLATIYVDGVYSASDTAPTEVLALDYDLEFGRIAYTGNFFGGWLNDIRMWNRCLTASEALSLYVSPWRIYEKKRLAYYYAGVLDMAIPTIKPAATISVVGTTVTVTQTNAADVGATRKLERRALGSTGAFTVVATDASPAIGGTLVDSSVPVGTYEYEVADYSAGGTRTFTGQRWGGVVIQASTWDTVLAVVRAQLVAQGIPDTDIYDGNASAANYADQTYILRPGEEGVVARANGDLVLRNYPVEIEFLAVALEEDGDDKLQLVRDAHDTIVEIFDGATPSDLPSLSALERSLVEITEKSNLASDEITDLVRSRLLVTFGIWETR